MTRPGRSCSDGRCTCCARTGRRGAPGCATRLVNAAGLFSCSSGYCGQEDQAAVEERALRRVPARRQETKRWMRMIMRKPKIWEVIQTDEL